VSGKGRDNHDTRLITRWLGPSIRMSPDIQGQTAWKEKGLSSLNYTNEEESRLRSLNHGGTKPLNCASGR
jgi:hypothetical protein